MKMKAIVETRSKRARRSLRREPAETNHIEKQDNDHSNTKQESPQNLRKEPAEASAEACAAANYDKKNRMSI